MLYPCTECGHMIAIDAVRCPQCGTNEAGSNAFSSYRESKRLEEEAKRDKTDPGWRERASKQSALEYAEYKKVENRKSIIFHIFLSPVVLVISFFFSLIGACVGFGISSIIAAIFKIQNPGFIEIFSACAWVLTFIGFIIKYINEIKDELK